MITNLRLKYYSPYKSSSGVRQLMLLPYTTLKRFVLIANGQFLSFFCRPDLSLWSTAKASVWKWSLGGLTSRRSLFPSASTSHASPHLRILPRVPLSYLLFRHPCTHPLHSEELKAKYLSALKKMQEGIFILFLKHTLSCFQLCKWVSPGAVG